MRHAALPSGEDGRGRVSGIDALARASGRAATATRGRLFRFGKREGKALGVPANQTNGADQAPAAATRHNNGTLATARSQPDGVRAQLCASAHPAMREARAPAGQHKNAAPSGARSAGQSASARTPAPLPPLLIVTRMGWDYRPGPRQRIEQVARRAAPISPCSNTRSCC